MQLGQATGERVHGAGHQRSDVVALTEIGTDDLQLAGGKGANLGELIRAGFPVPPGFVVTTGAYDRLVEVNQLSPTIEQGLRAGDAGGIRAAFAVAQIPAGLAHEIQRAYGELGQGPVAVRSSATAEDLPEAAFAGQQDTFLNVSGSGQLLDAVLNCWASLWTDRAVEYRSRLGLDQQQPKLAVVVQRMVPAEAAGVLFTANPVSGARAEVVVDASPGLGEAVVAGLATPDHFVLRHRRNRWDIVERRQGRREVVVRARKGGGTEHVAGSAEREPSLPDAVLAELARQGKQIERHFGRPQDIEWAWADGKVHMIQARPITALPAPPPRSGRARRLLAGLISELLPSRPYPLEMTTWVPTVYGFLTTFLGVLGLRVLPLNRLFLEQGGVVVRLSGRTPIRPTPALMLAPIRLVRLARRYDPAASQGDPLLPEAVDRVRRLERTDLGTASWAELLASAHEALAIPALIWEFRVRYLARPILAVARLRLLLALLGSSDRFGTLLFTGLETKTLEANRALEALAEQIRQVPQLAEVFASRPPEAIWAALEGTPEGRAFLTDVRAFLDEYGHRETGGTFQLSEPTWKDAPEVVLGMLKAFANSESVASPRQAAWQAARDDVLRHPLMRFGRLRSAFLGLLTEARYFPQLREDTRFYFMLPAPVLRRSLLEMGRRLADVGVLDTAKDVFHLRLQELDSIADGWPPAPTLVEGLRTTVVRRRARRLELESTPLVDPRILQRAAPDGEVLLRGTPGSPGSAQGPVRVIRESAEFGKLRAGEVLVAPFTNPAWTPLFQRAAAVVVDSGGAASHAAIVAREYGIPAVMATVEGTRTLTDGTIVRVDGSAGLVLVGEEDR